MSRLFDILQLESKTIESLALDVEPIRQNIGLTRMVKENIRTLESIQRSSLTSSMGGGISSIDFEIIADKLRAYDADRSTVSWSNIEIQALTFHLMSFDKLPNLFHLALTVVKENWKSTYINGLVYSLLNGWHDVPPVLRQECCVLLQKQLTEYKGRIPKYMKLREHTDFFEEVGPIRVSALLLTKRLDIHEAPSLLGLSSDMLSLAFFSDVIISYVQSQELDFNKIKDILDIHTFDRTKKLVLAHLVEEADKTNDPLFQDRLCKWVRDVMQYDVTLESVWNFDKASDEELRQLTNCHKLVKTWYARRTVETFFDLACQDRDRRDFWINYSFRMHEFRIVGSESVYNMLSNDERISAIIDTFYIKTTSSNVQTSALVIFIDDKILVEFSDIGSLYVYGSDQVNLTTKLLSKDIGRIESLKRPSLNPLIKTQNTKNGNKKLVHHQEGRLPHLSGWQSKLDSWFTSIMNPSAVDSRLKSKNQPLSKPAKPITETTFKTSDNDSTQDSAVYHSSNALPQYKLITPLFTSKELFNNKIQIIASSKGYFIKSCDKGIFYMIASTIKSLSGKITLSVSHELGFHSIIHEYGSRYHIIGFIKFQYREILFKKKMAYIPYLIRL